jgi:hypothetical protein
MGQLMDSYLVLRIHMEQKKVFSSVDVKENTYPKCRKVLAMNLKLMRNNLNSYIKIKIWIRVLLKIKSNRELSSVFSSSNSKVLEKKEH